MKHTIKGFLVYQTGSWVSEDERVTFQNYDPTDVGSKVDVLICPYEFEVDLGFDPQSLLAIECSEVTQ